MIKNILMIAVDDLRPEINSFGKTNIFTPNLDRLSYNGLIFENAYCQVPLCMLSRTATMSGIRPRAKYAFRTKDACTNNELTLPGHLKNNGYTTISIGKVYHHNDDDEISWTRRYTNTFYEKQHVCDGYCSGYQLDSNIQKLKNFSKNRRNDNMINNPSITECVDVDEKNYPDAKVAHLAVNELNELKDAKNPFFLAVGFYRPHLPWAVPKKYWDLYDREDILLADNQFFPKNGVGKTDLSDFLHYGDSTIQNTYSDLGKYANEDFPVLDDDKQKECIHGYFSSVSFMDAQVGKIINALEKTGLSKNTAIILWSDNGWHLGEHKLWSKVSSFEESTHVPMVISLPNILIGRKTNSLVELLDIYPTICNLLNLQIPEHVDGKSLLPIVKNPDTTIKHAIFSRINDAHTVRTKDFRLTHYANAIKEGDKYHIPSIGEYELFDLNEDPNENVNVFNLDKYSKIKHELIQKLK